MAAMRFLAGFSQEVKSYENFVRRIRKNLMNVLPYGRVYRGGIKLAYPFQ